MHPLVDVTSTIKSENSLTHHTDDSYCCATEENLKSDCAENHELTNTDHAAEDHVVGRSAEKTKAGDPLISVKVIVELGVQLTMSFV